MKNLSLITAAAVISTTQATTDSRSPNVLFILVDDLGWTDVGFTGANPDTANFTPNIDREAANGLVLNRHYAYKTCTPARSALQSGRLPVHVSEQLKPPDNPTDAVPYNMTTFSEILPYQSHLVGKWDAGMATTRHTPYGRGYSKQSLSYFSHKNEFFDYTTLQSGCKTKCETEGPGDAECIMDLWEGDGPAYDFAGRGEFVEYVFKDRALDIIDKHDPTGDPLFLLYSSHIAHCPLQITEEKRLAFLLDDDENQCQAQTARVNPDFTEGDKFSCRSTYSGMVSTLDDVVGELVTSLKNKGLYDNTLIVFTSDNGGAVKLDESAGNNYPLRGGKYADLEGGVRTAAFVGGGYYATHKPSGAPSSTDSVMHISDWYATFAGLAGLTEEDIVDTRASEAGLPPLDSMDLGGTLFRGEDSPHATVDLFLSSKTVMRGDYKFITGSVNPAGWSGGVYPNASSYLSPVDGVTLDCTETGCLFDIATDPSEYHNLINEPEFAELAASMRDSLTQAQSGFYENNDSLTMLCPEDIGNATNCGCYLAVEKYGGWFGPYASGE